MQLAKHVAGLRVIATASRLESAAWCREPGADEIIDHLLRDVASLIDAGRLRTTLTTALGPLTPATLREAHRLVETGSMIGKVALEGMA